MTSSQGNEDLIQFDSPLELKHVEKYLSKHLRSQREV